MLEIALDSHFESLVLFIFCYIRSKFYGSDRSPECTLAASFFVPFSHCAVKLYAIRCVWRHCRREFSNSSCLSELRIGTVGLWSVVIQ